MKSRYFSVTKIIELQHFSTNKMISRGKGLSLQAQTKIRKMMLRKQNAFQLRCPAIPLVRIALVGLGRRGMKTLERYAFVTGAEIRYIVDVNASRLEEANERLRQGGRREAVTLCGTDAWQEACQRSDVDLVYICTEWRSHASMAVYAMRQGKHVAVEVPAATTVDECWQLVRTAEETQRHCFMTENCCYDYFALQTLEMHRQGIFGDITHCEGAYIHDLTTYGGDAWMGRACLLHEGNPYPTHGIGPIAQLLGFHRGDGMESLVSLSSKVMGGDGLPQGKVNTTLIQTRKGVSIMLQLDVTTHRPYSRLQTVCGIQAFVSKYPLMQVQTEQDGLLTGEPAEEYMRRYSTSDASLLWQEGTERNVPNAMNYAMDCRLVHCLRNARPLDIDVYDAAEWSCLVELTLLSAQEGGKRIPVPDFLGED